MLPTWEPYKYYYPAMPPYSRWWWMLRLDWLYHASAVQQALAKVTNAQTMQFMDESVMPWWQACYNGCRWLAMLWDSKRLLGLLWAADCACGRQSWLGGRRVRERWGESPCLEKGKLSQLVIQGNIWWIMTRMCCLCLVITCASWQHSWELLA